MLKKKFTLLKSDSQVYLRLFLSLIICIIIAVMISSSVLYIKFRDIASNQVYNFNLSSLAQTNKQVSMMTEIAKTVSYQIFSDVYLSKLLYYSSPDIYDIRPAMDQLGNYRISLPFIDSVYIYNAASETFFVSTNNQNVRITGNLSGSHNKSSFIDKDIINIIDNIDNYKPFTPISRNFSYSISDSNSYSFYTFLCYDPLSLNTANNGIVVVNISEKWIRDVMTADSKNSFSDTFIVDSSGKLVSNSNTEKMGTYISNLEYSEELYSNPKTSGYIIDEVSGIKSFIIYTEPDAFGWRYIKVTPYDLVFKDIDNLKKNLIIVCIIVFAFSLLLALMVSKILSKPIDRKLSDLYILESENRTKNKLLKQEFLSNLLLRRTSQNLQIIQNLIKEYEINLNPEYYIIMFLIRIDNFEEFTHKYSIDDINLYKFGIGNIVTELCSPYFSCEVVDMGEDRVIMLFNSESDEINISEEELKLLFDSINDSMQKFMNSTVSITFSPVGSIENAGLLYNQVLEASYHRLFYGPRCIINSRDIMLYKDREYTYPMSKEKQLTESIMGFNSDSAKKIYLEIINETTEYPFTVINFVISHLALAITNTINIVCKNNSLQYQPGFNVSMLNLTNIESLEDINTKFFSLFDELKLLLEEKRNTKHDNLIQTINNIITSSYASMDLCLNGIADKLAMNPSYLGRVYRQKTLKALPDYITEVRINKAKELLQNTQYSIAEISEKIGFANSSYFYKTFKKYNGVTPNDFRKNLNIHH